MSRDQCPAQGEWEKLLETGTISKERGGGWWETEAQLTGIGAGALLSFCNGGADKKHPKYCLPLRSLACPKEQTSPATPEEQLGVTELQRAVKHCPDGWTMQPGFMAWGRTGRLGGLVCWASLCSATGHTATWWPKQNSKPLWSPHPLTAARAQPLTQLQTQNARKVS